MSANTFQQRFLQLSLIALLLGLCACASSPPKPVSQDSAPTVRFDPSKVKPAIPRPEARSRYGNHSPYTVFGKKYQVMESGKGYKEKGIASWYGAKFHGRKTSSGELYDMFKMTAAHKSLPLPSYVKVTHLENNRTIIVRVNDRGPFHKGRVIDLSYAAAHLLGIAHAGTGQVKVEVISSPGKVTATSPQSKNATPRPLYVQIGAYSKLGIAQSVQEQALLLTPHPISIRRIQQTKRVLHRVLIGPLASRQQGNALVTTLREQKIGNAIVKQL
ncbi:MAG: septal ring lytic transglycosylase RlpA family protein [Gammaproteobacteria bacterium]|nr:septal ring lytic transglycosylase RlpA family protein [Gammaproteobacteria bacterium]